MDKTLYLTDSLKGVRIMRDGPSLWITCAETAGRRVPARLISRVMVLGNVSLDSGTIMLCAENSIPVFFLSRDASNMAMACSCIPGDKEPSSQQMALAGDPGRERQFRSWAAMQLQHVRMEMLKRIYKYFSAAVKSSLSDSDYREIISYLKPHEADEKWDIIHGLLINLFKGLISDHIRRAGLDPHLGVINKWQAFGLTHDILQTLEPEAGFLTLQFFRCDSIDRAFECGERRYRLTAVGLKNLVHRFEDRQYEIIKLTEEAIDEVKRLGGSRR